MKERRKGVPFKEENTQLTQALVDRNAVPFQEFSKVGGIRFRQCSCRTHDCKERSIIPALLHTFAMPQLFQWKCLQHPSIQVVRHYDVYGGGGSGGNSSRKRGEKIVHRC